MSEQSRELLITARNLGLVAWEASEKERLPGEVLASVFEVIVRIIDETLQNETR